MSDAQPIARPVLAHQFQAVFGPAPMLTAPIVLPIQPIVPDPAQLRGRPPLAQLFPSYFKAPRLMTPSVVQPLQPVLPSPQNLRGLERRVHQFPAIFRPGKFVAPVTPATPGYGVAGAATFILGLEPGAKVTYSWGTDIFTSYSGNEQRVSMLRSPSRRIDGTAFVLDAADRDLKGALVRAAAAGSTFLLALPFEEVSIAADAPNTTITVASTAGLDWAIASQRCVVVGVDRSMVRVIIQGVTSTTISIVTCDANWNFTFGTLSTTGRAGGRIMPCLHVLLDAAQGFARYATGVDLWSIRAKANVYGFVGLDSMGVGATFSTYFASAQIPTSALTDDDLLIWDRVNEIDGTASESMLGRSEVVDLGALPFGIGGATVPDWQRSLKIRSSSTADWQWFKGFIRHARGQQGAFLLSTNRPDLAPVSYGSAGLVVQSASVAGGGDYVSWFASTAHRRLAVTSTVGITYVTVVDVTDNGNGTLALALDSVISGTISKVSFLELVRLDSDDVEVTWDGGTFTADLSVVTVQDDRVPAFMFDRVIEFHATGGGTITINADLSPTTTLLNYNKDDAGSLAVGGLAATGGNVDGMIVCFCHLNNTNVAGFLFRDESTSATASNRFRNSPSAGTATGIGQGLWYRYHGTLQRWIEMMRT